MSHAVNCTVIKYGGNALASASDDDVLAQFANDLVQLHHDGMNPVVVHGGGPQISELMAQRGKQPEFRGGLRVTDAETIDIVRTALMTHVNPQLVDAINVHGPLSVGVSGEGLILAKVRDPELGFVGDVASIDPTILHELLTERLIPVVAPLGKDETGQTYNINADTVAAAIAVAIRAATLIYLTDVDGLRRVVSDESSLIRHATAAELAAMLADGTIANGMIPKVQGCIDALHSGVGKAHILDGRVAHVLQEGFSGKDIGTVVR